MKRFLPSLLVLAGLLSGGCIHRTVQQLPELSLACLVVDHATGQPIPGAWVSIVERDAKGGEDPVYHGPFVTNTEGQTRAVVRQRTVPVTESNFIYRSADIEARGYTPRTVDLDTPAARQAIEVGSPIRFDLFRGRSPLRPAPPKPKMVSTTAPNDHV